MFKALFMLKVTGSGSKIAPGSEHGVAQLGHGRNMCATFEFFPAYGHRDLARTKFAVIFRRIFTFKVTGSKSKGLTDVAQLDHGRNTCATLPPAYDHRDLARTKWQQPSARDFFQLMVTEI